MVIYGGPIANFRWDNMKSMQFKWLSIREMVPPGSHGPDNTNTKSKVAYASRFQGPQGYILANPSLLLSHII